MNYSICLVALLATQTQRLIAELNETLLPALRQIVELVVSFFAG
jgi:hypothetical protein